VAGRQTSYVRPLAGAAGGVAVGDVDMNENDLKRVGGWGYFVNIGGICRWRALPEVVIRMQRRDMKLGSFGWWLGSIDNLSGTGFHMQNVQECACRRFLAGGSRVSCYGR